MGKAATEDSSENVRHAAVSALSQIGKKTLDEEEIAAVTGPLVKAIGDSSPKVYVIAQAGVVLMSTNTVRAVVAAKSLKEGVVAEFHGTANIGKMNRQIEALEGIGQGGDGTTAQIVISQLEKVKRDTDGPVKDRAQEAIELIKTTNPP